MSITIARFLIIEYHMIKIRVMHIENIHFFGVNMTFITSSEVKNVYFISGQASNEIYILLLHKMK